MLSEALVRICLSTRHNTPEDLKHHKVVVFEIPVVYSVITLGLALGKNVRP